MTAQECEVTEIISKLSNELTNNYLFRLGFENVDISIFVFFVDTISGSESRFRLRRSWISIHEHRQHPHKSFYRPIFRKYEKKLELLLHYVRTNHSCVLNICFLVLIEHPKARKIIFFGVWTRKRCLHNLFLMFLGKS